MAEVTEPGKALPPGKIYDINAYSISTAVIESGGKPVYFGVVPDDKAALTKVLQTAVASADMVITSGGVSVGPRDYTPQIVDSLGKPGIVVYGIAVKAWKTHNRWIRWRQTRFFVARSPNVSFVDFLFACKTLDSTFGR